MTKREEILQVLSSVTDPWMNTDYVSARMAKISDDDLLNALKEVK